MDLDRCPRCGGEWDGGDVCPNCEYVPIGVGLKGEPKTGKPGTKKKKKYKKYVEPGSGRGCLSVVLLGLLGYGAFRYQPWQDDWEMVRALFGHGKHHSLVGDWEVVKTLAVSQEPGLIARDSVQKGSVTFSGKGTVALDLLHSETTTSATGSYIVDGTLLVINHILTSGDSSEQIPSSLNMNLTWTGANDLIATDRTEAIYLHRRKSNSVLATFMQMDLKKNGASAGAKGNEETRGLIGDVKRSAQEIEDEAKS